MNATGTLSVTGTECNASISTATLRTGWNLIGCPYATKTALASIFNTSNCKKVKNLQSYWIPNNSSSSLQYLEPGKGYYFKK